MNVKSNLSRAGLILRALNEYHVRNICGQLLYGAGVQDYFYGRVSQMKFSKDSLSGKIDNGGEKLLSKGGQKQQLSICEASIMLETSSKGTRYRTHGDCSCPLSREDGSLCSHVTALMIAWVRRPQDFEESLRFDFEDAKRRSIDSLNKLVSSIEEGGSRFKEDIEMLQRTYTKLGLWSGKIAEAKNNSINLSTSNRNYQLTIREFSRTINYVSFAIMFAIGNKYKIGDYAELYNKATVSTFGKVLDAFVQILRLGKSVAAPTVARPSPKEKKQHELPKSAAVQTQTARSWDELVEDFAYR